MSPVPPSVSTIGGPRCLPQLSPFNMLFLAKPKGLGFVFNLLTLANLIKHLKYYFLSSLLLYLGVRRREMWVGQEERRVPAWETAGKEESLWSMHPSGSATRNGLTEALSEDPRGLGTA